MRSLSEEPQHPCLGSGWILLKGTNMLSQNTNTAHFVFNHLK